MNRIVTMGLALAALAGCATPSYRLSVVRFGEVDVGASRTAVEAAERSSWDADPAVRAITGALPAGLELTENGQKLVVHPPWEKRYTVLGSVTSRHEYSFQEAMWLSLIWKPRYHPMHSGRDAACWIQAPFKLVTLGAWGIFPWAWPCMAKYPDDDDNLELHVRHLKRLTHALGGNLIILASRLNRQETSVSVYGNSAWASTRTVHDASLTGFAVFDRGEVVSPVAPVPPSPPPVQAFGHPE